VSLRFTAVVALVAALAGVIATSSWAAPPKLVGTVGPGFTITLTKGGKKVTKLPAGKYTFVIADKSSAHSYGLDGPQGFAKDFTTVPFQGTKTSTLTLKKGKYKFYCKAHESTMFGNFTVT
jgi:plastocyanin